MLPFPRGPQSPARDKRLLKAVDLARFGWVALGHPPALPGLRQQPGALEAEVASGPTCKAGALSWGPVPDLGAGVEHWGLCLSGGVSLLSGVVWRLPVRQRRAFKGVEVLWHVEP